MTEDQKLMIEQCARNCERVLDLADMFQRAGNLSCAAHYFEIAESASDFAFWLAVQA